MRPRPTLLAPRGARLTRFFATTVALTGAATGQAQWIQRYPNFSPPARYLHGMAYDAMRDRTVLFGGREAPGTTRFGDTWEWTGSDWQVRSPANPPAPRYAHAMAFDHARNRTLMFGGRDANNAYLGETWEWDGAVWNRLVATGPRARSNHTMVSDPVRREVLLFGGNDATTGFNDLWIWNGATWRLVPPAAPPAPVPAPGFALLACDTARDVLVLVRSGETWEWNLAAAQWTRRTPPISPSPRTMFALAHDPERGRTVLFGGGENVLDTWEWDGSSWWFNLAATRHLVESSVMVWDAMRGRIVSFGGERAGIAHSSTWEYVAEPRASFSAFGTGCIGSAGTPTLMLAPGQLPVLGESFALELGSLPQATAAIGIVGRSDTSWAGLALPFDLSPLGMTGCSLLTGPDCADPIPTLQGTGTWLIRVPLIPSLSGEEVFVQALISDPAANALGMTTTNGGRGVLGSR